MIMSQILEMIDPSARSDWDQAVLSSDKYSFFHSTAWAKVLMETYQYTPRYLVIRDQDGPLALHPIMEIKDFWKGKRGVSLPFNGLL